MREGGGRPDFQASTPGGFRVSDRGPSQSMPDRAMGPRVPYLFPFNVLLASDIRRTES